MPEHPASTAAKSGPSSTGPALTVAPLCRPALQNPPRPLPRRIRLVEALAHVGGQGVVGQPAGGRLVGLVARTGRPADRGRGTPAPGSAARPGDGRRSAPARPACAARPCPGAWCGRPADPAPVPSRRPPAARRAAPPTAGPGSRPGPGPGAQLVVEVGVEGRLVVVRAPWPRPTGPPAGSAASAPRATRGRPAGRRRSGRAAAGRRRSGRTGCAGAPCAVGPATTSTMPAWSSRSRKTLARGRPALGQPLLDLGQPLLAEAEDQLARGPPARIAEEGRRSAARKAAISSGCSRLGRV